MDLYPDDVEANPPGSKDGTRPHRKNAKTSTVRYTNEDIEILDKIEERTGLKRSQIIRAAIRDYLRRLEGR